MAAIQSLVLNDSVPAARTFLPAQKDGLDLKYVEDGSGAAELDPSVQIVMRKPQNGVNRKVSFKVEVPYEVTSNGITTTAFVQFAGDVIVPSTAPDVAIDDSVAYVIDLLGEAQFTDAVNGFFPY